MGVAPLGVFVIFRVLLKRVTWPRGRGEGDIVPPRADIVFVQHASIIAIRLFVCFARSLSASAHAFVFFRWSGRPLGFSHTCPTGLLCERNAGPLLCRETMRHSRSADHSAERRERERTGSFVSPDHVGKRRRFIPFFLFFFYFFLFHLYSFFFLSFYSRPSRCCFFFSSLDRNIDVEILSNKPRVREVSFEHSFFFEKILRFIRVSFFFFFFFMLLLDRSRSILWGGRGYRNSMELFDPCNYYFSLFY